MKDEEGFKVSRFQSFKVYKAFRETSKLGILDRRQQQRPGINPGLLSLKPWNLKPWNFATSSL